MQTFCTDGHQFDSFAFDEIQSLVDIGYFVEPHFSSIRLWQLLSRYDLEEQHQFETIPEVFLYDLYLGAGLAQMGVAPSREGLQRWRTFDRIKINLSMVYAQTSGGHECNVCLVL